MVIAAVEFIAPETRSRGQGSAKIVDLQIPTFDNQHIVGVTGPKSAGKTKVTAFMAMVGDLHEVPVQILDLDLHIRNILIQNGTRFRKELLQKFGAEAIDQREVDLDHLEKVCSLNFRKLDHLTSLVWRDLVRDLEKKIKPNGLVLLESRVLLESGFAPWCQNRTIYVDCPESTLKKRRGLKEEDDDLDVDSSLAIISLFSPSEKRKLAERLTSNNGQMWIIQNDNQCGTILLSKVKSLFFELCEHFSIKPGGLK